MNKRTVLVLFMVVAALTGCELIRRISVIGEAIVTTSVLDSLCKSADRSDPEVDRACESRGASSAP